MPALIFDHHTRDGEQRLSHLKKVLEACTGEMPESHEQVYGVTSRIPAYNKVRNLLLADIRNRPIVLLHCGREQQLVLDVLSDEEFRHTSILCYYGGPTAEPIRMHFRSPNCSPKHALIPDEFRLEGLMDAQKKALTECVKLILGEPPVLSGEAVDRAFGDPRLEGILNDLYKGLAPGVDFEALGKKRDNQLGKYYEEKRGW